MNARLQAKLYTAARPTGPALEKRLDAMYDARNALQQAYDYAERGSVPRPGIQGWFLRAGRELSDTADREIEVIESRSFRDLLMFAAGLVIATAVFVALGLAASYA